jgi:hypothetical protein
MPHWAFPIRTSAPSLSHVRSKIAIIVSIINRFMTSMTYALRDLSDRRGARFFLLVITVDAIELSEGVVRLSFTSRVWEDVVSLWLKCFLID